MLRLQEYQGYSDSFVSVFGDRFDRLLCVRHLGKSRENPHYHFVFRTDYKDSALRKYLKLHFTQGKGNGHMSLKPWDGQDEALSYMFHEGTDPIMNKGFSQDEINGLKEKDLSVRESHVKASDMCQLILDEIMALPNGPSVMQREVYKTRRYIFGFIYSYFLKKGEWMPNRFQFERYINRIRMLYVIQNCDKYKCIGSAYADQLFTEYFGVGN